MSATNSNYSSKHTPKIFPKLFIGSAAKAFLLFIKRNGFDYTVHNIATREDLINLIDTFSSYKNYNQPLIISDISFLNASDQSLLLKFMEDSSLKIILLASRDNILNTIISRVKEFRKYYSDLKNISFIKCSSARENIADELSNLGYDASIDDRLIVYNKYNPILGYTESLVKNRSVSEKDKLLNLLESDNE